ncbi:MAG: carbamoyltransferase HypF [Thermoguttaceae bacterium]|jgi:hydrogenase maturation protein HypF
MNSSIQQQPFLRRLAISVHGVVQGVGFRPFVYNSARAKGLCGWVLNQADAVRMEVQGQRAALDEFVESLRNAHPPQARIDKIEIREVPCEKDSPATFEIRASIDNAAPGPSVPADLAACAQCLAEIRDPHQRRYRYPFTNCTNCGPRWSIIEQLPYDRARTSMAGFTMCPDCRAEYENPADRRFHAQPIACPKCGPHLELIDSAGNYIARGEEAITLAAAMVLENCVLAVKGLGGFQLVVDATSADAVARLRERKHRPDRPFALMISTLDEVRRDCDVSEEEAKMLDSHRAPIVLLRKYTCENCPHPNTLPKGEGTFYIVEGVAPGNPYLGVMLPYTPLHCLLMEAIGRPVVCTSGNLSEDPMAICTEDAIGRLGSIADVILTHDRPIVRPVDDSIVRLGPCGFQVMRRARGFAPLPIRLKIAAPTILAVGGHLKNTVALCLGCEAGNTQSTVVMTPHIGDLDNILGVRIFQRAIEDMVNFFAVKPEVVVCDLHPDYASTREAESLAARWGVPLVSVQHHHAHAAAAMAEHNLEGPVLALAWDGTGYGSDGTVWGGEALRCDGPEFSRAAHLRTFSLPGGDKAMYEPRRSALGLLYEFLGDEAGRFADIWFKEAETTAIMRMLERRINCPRTSSMGRLFDAVAALCGLPKITTYEGQAAMALEFAADKSEPSAYAIPLRHDEKQDLIADWEPMFRVLLADLVRKLPVGIISARFHNALADLALDIASSVKLNKVVLSGGCFQNALLTERVYNRLHKAGFSVYLHKEVPPGDGGIALGQIFVAALKNNPSQQR